MVNCRWSFVLRLPSLITSTSNDKVKFARSLSRKKARSAARQFVVEGTRVIGEAERAGAMPALVFFEPTRIEADARARTLLNQLYARAREIHPVTELVLDSLAQTETPQGIVAIYPYPNLLLPDSPQLLLILDAVRDPGNVGTILRTAWASNVSAVLFAPDTADAFNPKVVRAAMGAHFSVPIATMSWDEIAQTLKIIPRIYLADARGEKSYQDVDWSPSSALIVSGEAEGASAEARQLATARVSIPMPAAAESLNVAVATGILLFKALTRKA